MFDGNLRSQVDRRTQPVGIALASIGITADILTLTGVVMSVVTGALLATSHLFIAFIALVASSVPDLLDGPVAKARGTSSARGAFFDSVSDRFSDLMITVGLSFYFIASHHTYLVILPFGVYGSASLISYQRAKAESLGFNAKGGIMERAERLVLLMVGILIPPLLIPILWLVLVLSVVTVFQRFIKVWAQASNRDNRVKLRIRQSYQSRKRLSETSLKERFRSGRGHRADNRRSHRVRVSQANADRSRWFTSKFHD
ncbi:MULTISPECIES: CDP-alcohol phosphatidyltransferase family protein [Acidithrix]|uniref:CDP-diacylglycerol--inositol 3-phosphatidyltransferase n=1 Tax=Acidithrix ferrooxidans TaxID=1280514 RepID=A0A0D8HK07_9ACTN|nr:MULTISPECIES: CDP-alcohol phosphatidyltransferase family protein [Acidithrix]KJF18082.1 CDP-diacylglycerol--inositol 3-phosphatidyltransferase [Acidithrix ferrooxidans]